MERLGRAAAALAAPRVNWRALVDCITTLWKHRRLSLEIVKRDLGGQKNTLSA